MKKLATSFSALCAALLLSAAISLPAASSLSAQSRALLAGRYAQISDSHPFKTGGEWFPYPEYADREGWKSLLGDAAAIFVNAGEQYLGFSWRTVPATAYLAYERTGVRPVMETPMKENRMALNALMLAELSEGKGRFIDDILNGVWQIAHMPSWVLSAHQFRQPSRRALPDAAIAQSVRSVDMFLNYVKSDGACEEGPAYWGHAAGKLCDYIQILYDASDGIFDVFDDPQVKAE